MNRQCGEILDRKFRLDRVLGEGGFGTVFAATDLVLDRPIALKLLLPEHSSDGHMVERFLREARIAAKIRNRYAVQVYEAGQLSDGQLFIAMELLEGEELSELLGRRGPLPLDEVLDYGLQACEGLAAAHALGVVHRDVKPSNLFVTADSDGVPVLKILDFGISSIQEGAGVPLLTTADVVMGTTEYSAPEQLRCARRASVRSDLWSLAVVLYEALAGHHPFAENSEVEVSESALAAQAEAELPAGVREVLLRCLKRDPSLRFSDAGKLASALAYYGRPAHEEQAIRIQRLLNGSSRREHGLPSTPALSSARGGKGQIAGGARRMHSAPGDRESRSRTPREQHPHVHAPSPTPTPSGASRSNHGIGALETKLASRGWKMAVALLGTVAVPAFSAILTVRYLDSVSSPVPPPFNADVQEPSAAEPRPSNCRATTPSALVPPAGIVAAAVPSVPASSTAPFVLAYSTTTAGTQQATGAAASSSAAVSVPESGPNEAASEGERAPLR